jgi:hypothetical protein
MKWKLFFYLLIMSNNSYLNFLSSPHVIFLGCLFGLSSVGPVPSGTGPVTLNTNPVTIYTYPVPTYTSRYREV